MFRKSDWKRRFQKNKVFIFFFVFTFFEIRTGLFKIMKIFCTVAFATNLFFVTITQVYRHQRSFIYSFA